MVSLAVEIRRVVDTKVKSFLTGKRLALCQSLVSYELYFANHLKGVPNTSHSFTRFLFLLFQCIGICPLSDKIQKFPNIIVPALDCLISLFFASSPQSEWYTGKNVGLRQSKINSAAYALETKSVSDNYLVIKTLDYFIYILTKHHSFFLNIQYPIFRLCCKIILMLKFIVNMNIILTLFQSEPSCLLLPLQLLAPSEEIHTTNIFVRSFYVSLCRQSLYDMNQV